MAKEKKKDLDGFSKPSKSKESKKESTIESKDVEVVEAKVKKLAKACDKCKFTYGKASCKSCVEFK